MTELAISIADEAAKMRIELCCDRVYARGRQWWRIPPSDDPDVSFNRVVIEAIEYLELRGHIEHDSRCSTRIRFIEPEA